MVRIALPIKLGAVIAFAFHARAQLIERPEAWLEEQFRFNPRSVKEQGLDSLFGTYYIRVGQGVFKKTSGKVAIQFDEWGRARSIQRYKPFLSWSDSVNFIFQYDEQGHLREEIKEDRFGYYQIIHQQVNELLSEEAHYLGLHNGSKMLVNEYENRCSRMSDSSTEILVNYKKGNVYKKSICREKGGLDSSVMHIVYPGMDTTYTTYHTNLGRVDSIHIWHDKNVETVNIGYDDTGEITSIQQWLNGHLGKEIQFVYTFSKLSSIVFLIPQEQRMEILKF